MHSELNHGKADESETSPKSAKTHKKAPKSTKGTSKKTGTVKWFNATKGYGFITQDEGEDLFVHQSVLHAQGFRSLAEGEKLEFDVEDQGNGKFRAINVTGPDGEFVKGDGGPQKYEEHRGRGRGRGGGRGGGRGRERREGGRRGRGRHRE